MVICLTVLCCLSSLDSGVPTLLIPEGAVFGSPSCSRQSLVCLPILPDQASENLLILGLLARKLA